MSQLYFVFDVESVGLHGEGFAVGVVVVDEEGKEVLATRLACEPAFARGDKEGALWVQENLPNLPCDYTCPRDVRDSFWSLWWDYRNKGALMVSDCGWPVEANFLRECIADDPDNRKWEGPYPLHDLCTALLLTGRDPLGNYERLPSELPMHDPLADARQSARIWLDCLRHRPLEVPV